DSGNFGDILSADNVVAMTDPVYPVYNDSNVMAGRKIITMPCTAENNFIPALPTERADMIYLCYPNNPTGTVLTRDQLKKWVDYANENGSLILFDGAYEAFIRDAAVPRSIYEIPGAENCAVEFRSFSKTAGFTGTRCAYSVVPKAIKLDGDGGSLNQMWNRRQSTKFNGAPYIIQRGAEATFSDASRAEIGESIAAYQKNAQVIKSGLTEMGYSVWGGDNAPYVWMKTPDGIGSWDFFDRLLSQAKVVGTPGAGFGKSGEGYFRLTAFNTLEKTRAAMERIRGM
ncbi:MAG: LL-diaminopimelate aminotransferase, partial [Rickettsiales bacterium]|nr:LL-diaminopimelate aminotransferase [Rickettsiales bacterium]